jgi:asparagine synthetase B (glutamine-hydrolysing)
MNFDRQRWIERPVLEAMNQQIVHRGPDDAGFYLSENVGLAMRRLSIIDLQSALCRPRPVGDQALLLQAHSPKLPVWF